MSGEILRDISALCVGGAALAFGDPSGGIATATALGGVAALVLGRRMELAKECDRVFGRVQRTWEKEWEKRPLDTLDREAVAAVNAQIRAEAGNCLIDKAALAETAFAREKFPQEATRLMLAKLGITVQQHHSEIAVEYATGLISAGLSAAMEQEGFYRGFRLELSLEQARRIGLLGEDVRELTRKVDGLIDRLDTSVPRDAFENLAMRFGHDNPDAPVGDLEAFLRDKAREWKDLKAQAAKLDEGNARIANVRAAVEAAIEAADFAGARARLDEALELQVKEVAVAALRPAVEMYGLKAETWLLEGDADAAADSFEAGAMLFTGVDRMEEATARWNGALRLYGHGLRYGGAGLLRAIEAYRRNDAVYTPEVQPVSWAGTQNNLANALSDQAARVEGAAGADLLAEAVTAYRAALEVYTREAQPVDWAMTQNNLANALRAQAARVEGAAGADLLAGAVTAFRAALEVYTREAQPVDWAMTLENLGLAFEAMGDREIDGRAARDRVKGKLVGLEE